MKHPTTTWAAGPAERGLARGLVLGLLISTLGIVLFLAGRVADRQQLLAWHGPAHNSSSSGGGNAASGSGSRCTVVRLFVGVLSAASNTQTRLAVRETWGADPRLTRVAFFSLRPRSNATFLKLQREAATYGDVIVVSEIEEDYYRVTHSTLALFRAAAAMGPDAITHVLKTDDDCYMRVPLLLAALAGMPRHMLYAGWPMHRIYVSVDKPNFKWRVSRHNMPARWSVNTTVRYGWGLGYVLSIDLAAYIGAGAPHLLMRPDNLLVIEDQAMGMWVATIAAHHNISVHYDGSMQLNSGRCSPQDVITHITPQPKWEHMRCMHLSGGGCCGFPP